MVALEVIAWIKAFALTALLEIPAVVICYRRATSARAPTRVALAAFAQLASHPVVWFVFPRLGMSYIEMVAWAEAWAVLSETAFYAVTFGALAPRPAGDGPEATTWLRTTWLRAFSVALFANGLSFTMGLAIRALTGWV